jgi:hypothetical protein
MRPMTPMRTETVVSFAAPEQTALYEPPPPACRSDYPNAGSNHERYERGAQHHAHRRQAPQS